MTTPKPKYRVEFWFLNLDQGGWCQLGWAHVEAKSREHALGRCSQRALKLGHVVSSDTQISVREEDGSPLLRIPLAD